MNGEAFFHQSDSVFSYPVSKNKVRLILKVAKSVDEEIKEIHLIYGPKYSYQNKRYEKVITRKETGEYFVYYICENQLKDVRFAYIFKIITKNNKVYYYSENGLTESFNFQTSFYDFFQVSYINQNDLVLRNKKFQGRLFYEIFVDRFFKSKENINPRITQKWGTPVERTSLLGGDLKGVTKKIKYLKNLGVGALYLTPIFESPSNHKYDCVDYYHVSHDFGTNEDLKTLVDKLHQNNILLVLDLVFNHLSSDHPFFKDVMEKGRNSEYYHYFYIHGDKPKLEEGNYEMFASCPTHPKVNLNYPPCQEYFLGVMKHYLEKYHIDGYRLDVSDEVPISFWKKANMMLKELDPSFFLIGENWHNAEKFVRDGDVFMSVMNYPLLKETLRLLKGKISPHLYSEKLTDLIYRYPKNVDLNLLNLLSSHDTHRFLTEVKDIDKFLIGYALLFFYPGLPMVYYGDEVGLEGGYDPDSRRCFPWKTKDWNIDIYSSLKDLIKVTKKLRKEGEEYRIVEENKVIKVIVKTKQETYQLLVNLSNKDVEFDKEVIYSRHFKENKLQPLGFLINKEDHL